MSVETIPMGGDLDSDYLLLHHQPQPQPQPQPPSWTDEPPPLPSDPLLMPPASGPTWAAATPPTSPRLSAFATSLLSLPPELVTLVLLFLTPDDLGVLARTVHEFSGVEDDAYLWRVWFRQTAPSRLQHALFSPLSLRPDPLELVRRGTLRGVAVVSGVRSGGYWSSESAVRLSKIHADLHARALRRTLSTSLSPSVRPAASTLVAARILPGVCARQAQASAGITARAHELERARQRDAVRRALVRLGVGARSFADVVAAAAGIWHHAERVEQRLVWAICPGIKEKKRFYESLARW